MDLEDWLVQPPTFTSFRINNLKTFDSSILQKVLEVQSKKLNAKEIPKFYKLKPDCLILEQWPMDVAPAKTGKEVVVDALCAAAVLRGAHVFAPGVLGMPTNCKLNERVDVFGDLDGKCKRGLKISYGGKKQYVGSGYLKMNRSDLFDNGVQPSGIAISIVLPASRLPVVNETLYPKGVIVLQNLPSIICGWVVDAKPNEHILDMCAAPGNKTTHLAEMSFNQAYITAIDKTTQKVARIEHNCETQGVSCVQARVYDSTKCYTETSNEESNSPPYPANTFDKILLDAPCSGLGQRPQLVNKMTPKMIQSYKFIQRKLFAAAVNILKVNGELTYSTCTVTEDENEGMVAWVLDKFPCMQLIPATPLLGGPGLANKGLNDEQRGMVQRFGPEDDTIRPVGNIYRDTIGFFIAKFKKCSNTNIVSTNKC